MRVVVDEVGSKFSRHWRFVLKGCLWLRSLLQIDVWVRDGERTYVFTCEDRRDIGRSLAALTKEPGTHRWIRKSIQPGDVVYDIGANIGIYTIMAAAQVGPTGQVYAFEPHAANFARLLRNIAKNEISGNIKPCNIALHGCSELLEFYYRELVSSSSDSQLGVTVDSDGQAFQPQMSEPKVSFTVDDLIFKFNFPQPDHVKIDVDGNELLILHGMRKLLTSTIPPVSIQIEVNMRSRDELIAFMLRSGYRLVEKHYTTRGEALIEAGKNPDDYVHNAIFRREQGSSL